MTDAEKAAELKKAADYRLGFWLSAALDDPTVCEEMKVVIREWFEVTMALE